MIKVSVIVPVYNVELYLDRCLNSIKNQTLKEIEVIVVNDGTKDNSQKIIDEYVKKDKRFKSFIKENGGLSSARNYGMKYAKGEYLSFIDSDDYIEFDMFEKMYNLAKKYSSDVVECDFVWEYPNKNVYDKTKVSSNDYSDLRVVAWNKLYKRSFIEKLNINFTEGVRYEDVDWCYKYLPFMKNFKSLNEVMYHYIQRDSSIANTQNEKVRDIFIVLDNIIKYYKEKNLYGEYKEELEYFFLRILLGSSYKRIIGITDKNLREKILKENWQYLNKCFPNWKNNIILKSKKNLKNRYYKLINYSSYMMMSKILRIGR